MKKRYSIQSKWIDELSEEEEEMLEKLHLLDSKLPNLKIRMPIFR